MGIQHAQDVQQQYQQQQQQARASHGPVKRRHSADSFDDEINALPGIGDNMILSKSNGDDDLASCDSLFGDDDQDDVAILVLHVNVVVAVHNVLYK